MGAVSPWEPGRLAASKPGSSACGTGYSWIPQHFLNETEERAPCSGRSWPHWAGDRFLQTSRCDRFLAVGQSQTLETTS